ncbi:hypothetical protein HK100_011244 [Physocladia obscura]|uniref:TIR domain-containing protein n=1 Tax=Physocladia obscura TaxID=109957 RepID=A0AAD5T2G7_9FUNG|nr:hypothetical protein HK100_011244 [Physocladia obscura]
MGSNDHEYLNEVLPRSKLFVILISADMIEEFKTAHERVCYPLLELEKAIDLGSQLAIIPIFLDNTQDLLNVNRTFDDYPNDFHYSRFSAKKQKVRDIVSSISQRWGYTFKSEVSEMKKGDLDGLVRNLLSETKKHLENNLRWNILLPAKPKYDVFISYRVKSERDLAMALFYVLSAERQLVHGINRGLEVYLDKKCLKKGTDWNVDFLNGIRASAIVVVLISKDSVTKFVTAHESEDNLLLELESAFDILDHRKSRPIVIVPVFINGFIPNPEAFPKRFHYHPSSPRILTIHAVVTRLSQLQGVSVYTDDEKDKSNFQAAESLVPGVTIHLKEHWAEQEKRANALLYPEVTSSNDKDEEAVIAEIPI